MMNKYWKLILVGVLMVHFFLLIYLKFTAWPEMLLWPYLIIQGWLPYKDIAIAHTPNLIIALSLFFKLFGVGIFQLKIFTWILILFSDLSLFWVVKKIWDKKIALISVLFFVFWQIFFDGNGLWFDLALVPLSIWLFYLLHKKSYFWAGVVFTLGLFTKQTFVWFLAPIILELSKDILRPPLKIIKSFVLGAILVVGLYVTGFYFLGIFQNFYNWAINFGIFILPKAQGQIQLPNLKSLLVAVFPFLMFIPLSVKSKKLNLIFWAIAGAMGTYPRFEYFHIQPALPFLAIASAIVLTNLKNKFIKIFIIFYILGSSYLLVTYVVRDWKEGTRFFETNVSSVVDYVKNNSKQGDKIFVMNWWDNIYPLTDTLPATDPWVPQLPWYQESSGIQDKEEDNLRISNPKLILINEYFGVGLSLYKPQKVYDYVMKNYKLKEKVGGIDILIPKK